MDEQKPTEEKTFTQSDIDKAIGREVANVKREYADYEELKAKVAEYEAMESEASDAKDPVAEVTAKHEAEMQSMREEIEALKTQQEEKPKPQPKPIGEPTNGYTPPDRSAERLLKDAADKAKKTGSQADIVAYGKLKKQLKR
ncbi:hypothetical protein [Rummeliibacillus suwonensis]|uniref:hypothetical protein n=1 Tax=Rummeliibacillus suwonensis TaxID=1306154 RepID=UPI0011B41DE3|nr:hypothetical protein [Rummeliibacillus suwonensis]